MSFVSEKLPGTKIGKRSEADTEMGMNNVNEGGFDGGRLTAQQMGGSCRSFVERQHKVADADGRGDPMDGDNKKAENRPYKIR